MGKAFYNTELRPGTALKREKNNQLKQARVQRITCGFKVIKALK
jgi:hypothetical protein